MTIEITVTAYDFDSLLIDQGADEILESIEQALEQARNYSNNWERVFEMQDHMEAVSQYEAAVFKRVAEKLMAIYGDDQ